MESEIAMVAGQLAAAIELTMNPNASQEQRLEAYNACESFKEKSPLCIQCGLLLAQGPDYSHYVRHFGLQLMEHSIKYKWYNMSQQEKVFVKEKAMKLLEEGMSSLLIDNLHLRDALSRVIVEMIKREWPQHWGSLLAELNQASQQGTVQAELVLLVLLRLVEDVVILQTLESAQRRKDLHQALSHSMADLFAFFLALMDKHFQLYAAAVALGNNVEANSHARVVQVVLLTLVGFVEWVNMTHIFANNGRLLQVLCLLLSNQHFQDGAADCLLHILSRKGKFDERKPFLMLFSKDVMMCIFQAADTSNVNYQFLKKLIRVLVSLGTQLLTLWIQETDSRPPNFELYLEAIVSFTKHPSLTLVHYSNTVLHMFMKHKFISKDKVFLTFIPKWVETTAPKLTRVVYPMSKATVHPNTPEYFAVIDYDANDEFTVFYHRYKVELLDAFRQATVVAPLFMYEYVSNWLQAKILQERMSPTPPTEFSPVIPIFLEWDALTQALDAIFGKIGCTVPSPDVTSGLSLIELCLTLDPLDPTITSSLLSCISALFVFLTMTPPQTTDIYLPRVLDKIFSTLVFSLAGETKTQRSRGVKNLHRHAASLMVKIAQKYPQLLLPLFSKIHSTVRDLMAKPDTLSSMEATTLQEALLLISNHICNYEEQCRFVGEVINPIREPWLAMASTAFASAPAFMAYVGLDKPPVEPSAHDTNGQNRSQIQWCLDVLGGVVKRCCVPTDAALAAKGGFTVGFNSPPVYRNPATPHILPMIPGMIALAHCMNALNLPASLALLSQGYQGAYCMVEVERQNLLGAAGGIPQTNSSTSEDTLCSPISTAVTPLKRMQQFISNTHDTLCHSLAVTFSTLGHEAYHFPNIVPSLISSILSNLECVPDYRLRTIVRVFIKTFVLYCPPSLYDTVLVPVMAHFSPFMYNRLCSRWQQLTEMRENGSLDDENTDTQEVLEDILNRTLTKEYLEVVKILLYGSGIKTGQTPGDSMEEEMDGGSGVGGGGIGGGGGGGGGGRPLNPENITDLGIKMVHCEATCTSLTLLLLQGLWWGDSAVSLKCTQLVGGLVVHLANSGRVSAGLAGHILTCTLYGLQAHGQHDSNQGSLLLLGTLLYSILRPLTDTILKVMEQIPNVNMTDLLKLDEKMLKEVQKGIKVDKVKKEMFRKVTNPLIGCNVSQLFQKKVHIRDLPRLEITKINRSPPDILNSNENDNSLAQLFNS